MAMANPAGGTAPAAAGSESRGVEEFASVTARLSSLKVGTADVSNLAMERPEDGFLFSPAGLCAICLDKIRMEDSAQIRGCEHAYCANCILRWASYKEDPWCPQCKLPFSSLFVCKTLDGRMSDFMFEESVCLLLRASWFQPLPPPVVVEIDETDDYPDEDEMYEEYYYTSNVRLGNRRWGDSGYVRGGRKEARPVSVRQVAAGEGGSADGGAAAVAAREGGANKWKGKDVAKESASSVGRRAKRAQKRVEAELKLKQKGCCGQSLS